MTKFTKPQKTALDAAFEKNGTHFANIKRTGGAFRCSCERMAEEGYLDERPPFRINSKGLEALHHFREDIFAKARVRGKSRPA